jgi:hypothetical protein
MCCEAPEYLLDHTANALWFVFMAVLLKGLDEVRLGRVCKLKSG